MRFMVKLRGSYHIVQKIRKVSLYYSVMMIPFTKSYRIICPVVLVLLLSFSTAPVWGEESVVEYVRDVKPIFKAHCYSCHGGLKQQAGLRLDTGNLIRKGSDQGPVLQIGNPQASVLVQRLVNEDHALRMPQDAAALSESDIGIIEKWIFQGAESPQEEKAEQDPRSHWAFQAPIRPDTPHVTDGEWAVNPIDAFIAFRQEQQGIIPNPSAKKQVLLKRIYMDLLGFPPTREELRAFLDDESESAYVKVVDRLLESPQYGERWGRHWMDVWRYSDWYGRRSVPDSLNSYGQIWRWRDWIVRSLNEDKGYDRMVVEMLAADEISPTDESSLAATGFIIRNFYRWNYNGWMKDMVEHTGKAFLGLTINCCHCHDHKYDPLSNEEYFKFRAFFEPVDIRHDRIAGEPDPGPYPEYKIGTSYPPLASGMVRISDKKLDAETYIYRKGESRDVIPGLPPVNPGVPSILGEATETIEAVQLPAEAWYPGLKEFVRQEEISKVRTKLLEAAETLSEDRTELSGSQEEADFAVFEGKVRVSVYRLSAVQSEMDALRAKIDADKVRYQGAPGDEQTVAMRASQFERQAKLDEARYQLAQRQHALKTAQLGDLSDEKVAQSIKDIKAEVKTAQETLEEAEKELSVKSSEYTPLGPQHPKQSTGRRTFLAQQIVRRDNPLTARVAVNHMWAWHFGSAIVETRENLGRNGSAPSHPRLLDWLAVEFMENGWKMKSLHRMIVTSQVYRMSSTHAVPGSVNSTRDPENRYFWRFNSHRVESEVVRDSILRVSGQLDMRIGGKEISESQGLTVPRRSLYFEHHGEGRMQWLELFDAPNPVDCYQRSTSIRPQQALAMANSELAVKQGRLLARRLHEQIDDVTAAGNRAYIKAAFEQILTRSPASDEYQVSLDFLAQQVTFFHQIESTSEETDPQSKEGADFPAEDPVVRARENLVQALFSHSDFLTVR